jgi:hypothetical protein
MELDQLEARFIELINNKEGILSKMSLSIEDFNNLEVA